MNKTRKPGATGSENAPVPSPSGSPSDGPLPTKDRPAADIRTLFQENSPAAVRSSGGPAGDEGAPSKWVPLTELSRLEKDLEEAKTQNVVLGQALKNIIETHAVVVADRDKATDESKRLRQVRGISDLSQWVSNF